MNLRRAIDDATGSELVRAPVQPSYAVSSDHYPRALEVTMQSQHAELEKLRAQVDIERHGRVEAERREEAVKTELINAQTTYALKLAEQRATHAEELEVRTLSIVFQEPAGQSRAQARQSPR